MYQVVTICIPFYWSTYAKHKVTLSVSFLLTLKKLIVSKKVKTVQYNKNKVSKIYGFVEFNFIKALKCVHKLNGFCVSALVERYPDVLGCMRTAHYLGVSCYVLDAFSQPYIGKLLEKGATSHSPSARPTGSMICRAWAVTQKNVLNYILYSEFTGAFGSSLILLYCLYFPWATTTQLWDSPRLL